MLPSLQRNTAINAIHCAKVQFDNNVMQIIFCIELLKFCLSYIHFKSLQFSYFFWTLWVLHIKHESLTCPKLCFETCDRHACFTKRKHQSKHQYISDDKISSSTQYVVRIHRIHQMTLCCAQNFYLYVTLSPGIQWDYKDMTAHHGCLFHHIQSL